MLRIRAGALLRLSLYNEGSEVANAVKAAAEGGEMFQVTDEEFDSIVEDAIDSIPEKFSDDIENLVFFWQDEPDPEEFSKKDFDPELLGLYDGVSLLERADDYGFGDFPDSITVFKGPHERMCSSRDQLREEVRRTIVHELGHFFGMDEDQIEKMGYR